MTRRQTGTVETPDGPETFTFQPDHYVFGNAAGAQVKDIKRAWEICVLKAHGITPEWIGRGGRLSADCRAKLAEIDVHVHDLRHEAGSRKLEAGWPVHAVSVWLGHADATTTARYLNVTGDYLHELTERVPLKVIE